MVYLLNACEFCILTHISPFVFASFPLSPKSLSKIVLPGKGTIGLHQLQRPFLEQLGLNPSDPKSRSARGSGKLHQVLPGALM